MSLAIINPELPKIVRRINDRQEELDSWVRKTEEAATKSLIHAQAQGEDIMKALAFIPRADQQYWLKMNCPRSAATARTYMRIARNWSELMRLGATSIRQALLLLCFVDAKIEMSKEEAKHWPAFIEASRRFNSVLKFIKQSETPLLEWPDDAKDRLKEQLQPIAAQLWPDKFVSA